MTGKPRKHSLTIAGHRTSISLEDDFWDALKEMSASTDRSIAELVRDIDATRGTRSLSSAIRSAVLTHYRTRGK